MLTGLHDTIARAPVPPQVLTGCAIRTTTLERWVYTLRLGAADLNARPRLLQDATDVWTLAKRAMLTNQAACYGQLSSERSNSSKVIQRKGSILGYSDTCLCSQLCSWGRTKSIAPQATAAAQPGPRARGTGVTAAGRFKPILCTVGRFPTALQCYVGIRRQPYSC